MTVENNLQRLAELSKIKFTSDELNIMANDMASIIDLMDSLRSVDLPLEEEQNSQMFCLPMLRDDMVKESMDSALLASQSPEIGDFSIPKIIE